MPEVVRDDEKAAKSHIKFCAKPILLFMSPRNARVLSTISGSLGLGPVDFEDLQMRCSLSINMSLTIVQNYDDLLLLAETYLNVRFCTLMTTI